MTTTISLEDVPMRRAGSSRAKCAGGWWWRVRRPHSEKAGPELQNKSFPVHNFRGQWQPGLWERSLLPRMAVRDPHHRSRGARAVLRANGQYDENHAFEFRPQENA